jgi:hypothetical protein
MTMANVIARSAWVAECLNHPGYGEHQARLEAGSAINQAMPMKPHLRVIADTTNPLIRQGAMTGLRR